MYTDRLSQREKAKMTLEEEEKALSSQFMCLDVEEESSSEVPFSNVTKNSKNFGRSSTLTNNNERCIQSNKLKVGAEEIPLVQRKKDRGKKTLVLDLDETLVHTVTNLDERSRFMKPFKLSWTTTSENGAKSESTAYTCLRPGVFKFLSKVTEMFEVVFFTASKELYAREVTKLLDRNKYFPYLLTRRDCTFMDGMFVKDLSVINRDLKDLIIIDNLPESYLFHKNNGLPIESWMGNPKDSDLEKMFSVLERLNQVDDVRPYIKQIVVRNKVSMYHLLRLIGPPRENSALDEFLGSLKDWKRGAAAFFGLTERESTAGDSKDSSSEEETNTHEKSDSNPDLTHLKLTLPSSSKNYFKKDLIDPDPLCETGSRTSMISKTRLRRSQTNSESGMISASYKCMRNTEKPVRMPLEYPKRRKPYNIKLDQKSLFKELDEDIPEEKPRVSLQSARHPLLNLNLRSYSTDGVEGITGRPRMTHSLGSYIVAKQYEASDLFEPVRMDSETSFEEGGEEEMTFA